MKSWRLSSVTLDIRISKISSGFFGIALSKFISEGSVTRSEDFDVGFFCNGFPREPILTYDFLTKPT